MRDPNRYGFSPDELQRLFGRSGGYEGDAWMERGGQKAAAPQGSSEKRGFRWFSLGTNTINQTDHMEREFREMAEPVAKALHNTSPTRARFEYGRPSHWNLNEMTTTTFTADKPHGMPTGYRESVRGGVIEVTSNRTVKFTR